MPPTVFASLRVRILAAVAVELILIANCTRSRGAEPAAAEWIRGSGPDLELCFRGEVLNAEGHPAKDVEVTCGLNARFAKPKFAAKMDGHRFEIWIPVNRSRAYSMWVKATSTTGNEVAYGSLSAYEFRHSARDGLKLVLKTPTRQVQVKVMDQGETVAGALVKADVGYGADLRSRSDAQGIARFHLLPQQMVSGLTAWTDDYRIGGFQSDRKPERDPNADEYVVELSRCRDQKLRFIDEEGKPVAGVEFVLQIATPNPNYNFIGTNENSRMTTDAAGEVIDKWFPDWEAHYFYVEMQTDQWVPDGENGKQETTEGAADFKLKRSKIAQRKRVSGRVVSADQDVGGYYVRLDSFQGEQKRHSDQVPSFTRADGTFFADVLPDATYCVYLQDVRRVSEIIDLIPFETATGEMKHPILKLSEGVPVELIVTSGPNRRPYPNLPIHLGRHHQYTWQEEGKQRSGQGGPQWYVTTDESGHAKTFTLPGNMVASVFAPFWRTQQEVQVRAGNPVEIRLHREVDEKRVVNARLAIADGLKLDSNEVEIRMISVGGENDDEQKLQARADGTFSFSTLSTEVALLASTKDGRAAGLQVFNDLNAPIELRLLPAVEFHGQLLGEDDLPLAGHRVWGSVQVDGKSNRNRPIRRTFEVAKVETQTDPVGNYTLRGLPTNAKVQLMAAGIGSIRQQKYLGEFSFEPGESRSRTVSHLGDRRNAAVKKPLAERYRSTLRDCALSGYRLMVILGASRDEVMGFIDPDLIQHADVYPFMQLVIGGGDDEQDAYDAVFLKEHNWQTPAKGRIAIHVLDAKGEKLDRLEIDLAAPERLTNTLEFLRRLAPPKSDAEKKWNEAFAEAKRSDRLVFARISQRFCGPCFLLSRWLDEQRALLEKDYVMLKIDDYHDPNGKSVAERLTGGEHHGVPFSAIFDVEGKKLIDSAGPLGNVGYPSGFDGKKQLKKMLLATRKRLTEEEIDRLVESVEE